MLTLKISEVLYYVEGGVVGVVVVMSAAPSGTAKEFYIISLDHKVGVLVADLIFALVS